MSTSLLLLVTVGSLYYLYSWISRWRMLKVAALTPTLSGSLPMIGHMRRIVGDFTPVGAFKFIQSVSKEVNENEGVMKGWLGPHLFYVITDPEDALTVSNACLKKHFFYRFIEPYVGEGLFTARNVSYWKRHRKLLIPAFNQHILDSFLVVFNDQSRYLMDRMACHVGNGEFEHLPYLAHNALETICRTALGMPKLGENLVTKEYGDAVTKMFYLSVQRVLKFWLHNDTFYNVSSLKKESEPIIEIFHKMSADVMKETIENKNNGSEGANSTGAITRWLYCNSGKRFKPFLDLMLELKEQDLLTEQEIRDELDTMIAAGFDTSSTAMNFTLLMLGAHPDVQNRVYEELIQVFGKTERDMEKEDLSKLVYMDAVIKETLRLFSIAPFVMRFADKDVKLKNTTIAAGSSVGLAFYGIHRHKVWGDDVETFRPERWLNPEELPKTPGAYAAFSIGRRNCIGKTYASMQMKTIIAHILRRYRLSGKTDQLILRVDFILKASSGCKIALEYR